MKRNKQIYKRIACNPLNYIFCMLFITLLACARSNIAHADYGNEERALNEEIARWHTKFLEFMRLDDEKVKLDIALGRPMDSLCPTDVPEKYARWNKLNNELIPKAIEEIGQSTNRITLAKAHLASRMASTLNVPIAKAGEWVDAHVISYTKYHKIGDILTTAIPASTYLPSIKTCGKIVGTLAGTILFLDDLCAADMSPGGSFMGNQEPPRQYPQLSDSQRIDQELQCRAYFDDYIKAYDAIIKYFGINQQVPNTPEHVELYNSLVDDVNFEIRRLIESCYPYGLFPYSTNGMNVKTSCEPGRCLFTNLFPGSGGKKKDIGFYGTPMKTHCGEVKPKKVLCTALYEKGLLPKSIWEADVAYAEVAFSIESQKNYQAWATPIADIMIKSRALTNILKPFITAWANQMAYRMNVVKEPDRLGAFLENYGLPISNLIGSSIRNLQYDSNLDRAG